MIEKEEKVTDIPNMESYHYHLFNKEFDSESTGEAIKFIIERNLMKKNKPKYMKMIFNSPGGDLSGAFALIDTMKGSKIPIYTYGLGEIASCGLMAFIAGNKGHRYITQNTAILSHQYSGGFVGKNYELMSSVKEFENTHNRIVDHYIKCTGLTEKDVKKYLLPPEDVWLTPKEAVKYGVADKIIEFY